MFWSKHGHLCNFFFRQHRPGKCLLWYSRTKKRLSRLWKQTVQKVEKLTFLLKGLTPGFGPNMAVFSTFFLGNIGQENVFNDILERINAFPGYKKNNPKSRKIYIFFKGVSPWFWSKNDHFSNFFLSNIRQKNVFYDILELSNALLFYKNKKSKNLKKMTFFKKRLTHAFCPK